MRFFLAIYVLAGIAIGYHLSKSRAYGLGKYKEDEQGEKRAITKTDRILYALTITPVWPLAYINYASHFRQQDIDGEFEDTK
tara:strand:- start:432 stop:677 length:246 start_codon:yes stop_codon:yes gene_type:complete